MLAALVVQLTLSVGPLVILLGVLLWIVNNPTNAEKLAFWFWSSFRFVSKTAEKNTIKTDITHRINDFVIRQNRELADKTIEKRQAYRGEHHNHEKRRIDRHHARKSTQFLDLSRVAAFVRSEERSVGT